MHSLLLCQLTTLSVALCPVCPAADVDHQIASFNKPEALAAPVNSPEAGPEATAPPIIAAPSIGGGASDIIPHHHQWDDLLKPADFPQETSTDSANTTEFAEMPAPDPPFYVIGTL